MNTDKVYSCTQIWTCLFSSGFNASNIWPYMNSVLFVLVQYMTSITTIYKHEFLKCPKASTSSQHFLYILKMFSIQEGRMEPLILYLKGKTCSAEECFGIANYSRIPFSFALNIAFPVILLSMMLLSLWSVWLQGCLWKGVEAAKENEAWTFMANSNIPFPAVCPEYCCFSFSFQMDQTQSFQLICQFPTIACWNSFNICYSIWIQIWCTRMRNYNVFCHKHVIFPHFIFYWPGIKFIWLVIIQFSLALLKCKDNQLFSFCLLFCILPCLLFCSLFWFVWLGVLVVKC